MLIYVLWWWPSWISHRHKKRKFVEDLQMIIPGQFGFNCPSGFREEAFWNIFSIGSYVKIKSSHGSHLEFPICKRFTNLVQDLPMIIPGQFGFNYPSGFREEAFWRSSVFYADRKSKMAATTGHSIIDANHYDFSVIVTNFGPKLRCYGQQSTCYGFPIIAGPKPFPI